MEKETEHWIAIARIGKPQGLTGGVRVHPFAEGSETLLQVEEVEIGGPEEERIRYAIREAEVRSGYTYLEFEGIASREDASTRTNQTLFVRRSDFPETHEGEYYCCDLIGFSVENESGVKLGELKEILPTGSNDVYVVAGEGEDLLLPAIGSVILNVDLAKHRVVVHPPEVIDAI